MNNTLPVYQMIQTALSRNHKPTLQNYIRSRQNSHIQQMICSSIDRTSNSSSRTLQAWPVLNWTGTENPQSVFTSGLAHSTTPSIVANATPSYVHPRILGTKTQRLIKQKLVLNPLKPGRYTTSTWSHSTTTTDANRLEPDLQISRATILESNRRSPLGRRYLYHLSWWSSADRKSVV